MRSRWMISEREKVSENASTNTHTLVIMDYTFFLSSAYESTPLIGTKFNLAYGPIMMFLVMRVIFFFYIYRNSHFCTKQERKITVVYYI